MRVITKKAILDFGTKHPDAWASLMNWYRITRRAHWRNLIELRADFGHADLVGRRTVFNIHGNDYRLIARVNFIAQRVFVLHVLTHKEYDKGGWKQ